MGESGLQVQQDSSLFVDDSDSLLIFPCRKARKMHLEDLRALVLVSFSFGSRLVRVNT